MNKNNTLIAVIIFGVFLIPTAYVGNFARVFFAAIYDTLYVESWITEFLLITIGANIIAGVVNTGLSIFFIGKIFKESADYNIIAIAGSVIFGIGIIVLYIYPYYFMGIEPVRPLFEVIVSGIASILSLFIFANQKIWE